LETQGIFSGTIPLLEKVLDLRSAKHNLSVTNIANMDTPHYKAFDLIFEAEVKKTENKGENLSLQTTHTGHFPGRSTEPEQIGFQIVPLDRTDPRGDANTVDIDREMANLAQNQLMYNAMAQIVAKKFRGLKSVIQGGGT